MIDSAFESQRAPAVAKRKHTNGRTIFKHHLAIRARQWIGHNLLVTPPIFRYLCQSRRSKIQPIQERGVIKSTEAKWLAAIEQVEHAISSGASLLYGRVPLPDNTCAPRRRIRCFKHIARGINVRSAGTHPTINPDAAPTGYAAAFDEVDVRFNSNCDNHQLAGDTRSTRGHHPCDLPMFACHPGNLFLDAHIDAVAPFLLEHQVRGRRIQHFRPQRAAA